MPFCFYDIPIRLWSCPVILVFHLISMDGVESWQCTN